MIKFIKSWNRRGRLREICGGWGSRLKWFQSKAVGCLGGGATLVKRLAVRDGCGVADEGFSGGGEPGEGGGAAVGGDSEGD
ncbi:hypothetical protein OIU79_019190 [Salix purpurea]|uniref:Uncharacterized protein n=1 Tax=Salix purpurea TaxID=77065 RepID=A0A9Q0P0P2_SALPP|nr:hypothetical protein OIU79_019190 [Salix purpurea]